MIGFAILLLVACGAIGWFIGFLLGAALAKGRDATKGAWIVAVFCGVFSFLVVAGLASTLSSSGPGVGIIHFFALLYGSPLIVGFVCLGLACCLKAGCFASEQAVEIGARRSSSGDA